MLERLRARLRDRGARSSLYLVSDHGITQGQNRDLTIIDARVFDKATIDHLPTIQTTASATSTVAGKRIADYLRESELAAKARPGADEYHSCFISYSSGDRSFAERLHRDLSARGVRCWYAPENMSIGDLLRPTIDRAIFKHDKFLLILSKAAVASHWVRDEVERAMERERKDDSTIILPITVDEAVYQVEDGWASALRNSRHIGDFSSTAAAGHYDRAFGRLLDVLKRATAH